MATSKQSHLRAVDPPQFAVVDSSDLPDPLVPEEVDFTNTSYSWFNLDARREMRTRMYRFSNPEVFGANLRLRIESWTGKPAASIEDDDSYLASLAGFHGRLDYWRKIKDEVMCGFLLCSDGRWYHEELAKRAVMCWEEKAKRCASGAIGGKKSRKGNSQNKHVLNTCLAHDKQIKNKIYKEHGLTKKNRGESELGNKKGTVRPDLSQHALRRDS